MNDINIVLILCKFKLMLLTPIRSEELPFTTVQVRYSSWSCKRRDSYKDVLDRSSECRFTRKV